MSRKKKKTSKVDVSAEETERAFNAHLQGLGMSTLAEYKDWCRQNNFNAKKDKTADARYRERQVFRQGVATARLRQSKREKRNLGSTIEQIFAGKIGVSDVQQPQLQSICRAFARVRGVKRTREALRDLLIHVGNVSAFFSSGPAITHLGGENGNTYLDALIKLAHYSRSWRRPIADWRPRTHNTRRRFADLARHLLADYEVPSFFDLVWFRRPDDETHRRWFIHVAQGSNIRTAKLPISFTKRMAHNFMQAPNDYTMEAALRWGQVHGLGGDARLAKAVRGTRLCETMDHDDFWSTVIRFFVAHPMLDTAHIGPIVDYLNNQRFVERQVFIAPGVVERQPPVQPNLSMKGRSPASLLEQVNRWHQQLSYEASDGLQWASSGIKGLDFVEGQRGERNMKRWTIRELLSAKALIREGRQMRHCVATYAQSCARRQTSIWTLELENFEGCFKELTVEVRVQAKQICQARGKFNKLPSQKLLSILQRWAAIEGLTLASYIA